MMIGPARARLLKYLAEASSLLEGKEKTSGEDETRLEELVERITGTCSLLERCNRDWINVLKDLRGEEKTKEEKEYERFSEGSEGFVEVMLDAGEMGTRLQSKLRSITRARAQNNVRELPERNGRGQEDDHGRTEVKVNLPKLQLPIFDGKISEWQEFWDIFYCSVHEQNLPAVSKFTYLKSVLRGPALTAIAGISVTGDNYQLAVKLLKDRFGKKEVIIELLYSKLQNLPRSGSSLAQVKSTCDAVEKLLRQLEAQGEMVATQRTLIPQIISKFPVKVITKFEETKRDPTIPWTMESLRGAFVIT